MSNGIWIWLIFPCPYQTSSLSIIPPYIARPRSFPMTLNLMGWLAWIVIGGIAGWLASMVMKSRQGLLMDIVVGIVGAFIGGFVMNLLNSPGVTGFNLWSLLVAF